jgi:hypothetical protein
MSPQGSRGPQRLPRTSQSRQQQPAQPTRRVLAARPRRAHWPPRATASDASRTPAPPHCPNSTDPHQSHPPRPAPPNDTREPPTWNPLLPGLFPDLTHDDFTQLTTSIERTDNSLRISTYNYAPNGSLLTPPMPGHPSQLQRLAWLHYSLGLDLMCIQEHGITKARLNEFHTAMQHTGQLPMPNGSTSTRNLTHFISPATDDGRGVSSYARWAGKAATHTMYRSQMAEASSSSYAARATNVSSSPISMAKREHNTVTTPLEKPQAYCNTHPTQ